MKKLRFPLLGAVAQFDEVVELETATEERHWLASSLPGLGCRQASKREPRDLLARQDRDPLHEPDFHRREIFRRIHVDVTTAREPAKELPECRLAAQLACTFREPGEKEAPAVALDRFPVGEAQVFDPHSPDEVLQR